MMNTNTHYDEKYFRWQRATGEFGGWANLSIFARYVGRSDAVLDFGCGGGYLLKNLQCGSRFGVEINPEAARVARENGVQVYAQVTDVPQNTIDVAVSFHALEHAESPLAELTGLYKALKPGGIFVVLVPCETVAWKYRPGDVNQHLYSWGPMTLGNLLTRAGFEVSESKPFIHQWPPKSRYYAKFLGRTLFEISCYGYGRIARLWHHVRAIARKP